MTDRLSDRMTEISLRDIYYIIFRHKWKALFFFLAVTTLVTFFAVLSPQVYRSEAKLLLRAGPNNVSLDASPRDAQTVSAGSSLKSQINSELEILRSRPLAEKVVDAIGPQRFLGSDIELSSTNTSIYATVGNAIGDFFKKVRAAVGKSVRLLEILGLRKPLDPRDKAILSVMKNLHITVPRESNIISISYEAKTRELAQEVLDKVIAVYLEKHITLHRSFDPCEFFVRKAEESHSLLAQAEQELNDCKHSLSIVSLADEERILLSRIGTLGQEMDLTEAGLSLCQAKAQELGRQFAKAQASMDKEDPAQASQKLGPRLRAIQSALVIEEANLSSLQAKAETLCKKEAEAQEELKRLKKCELQIAQLERKLDIHQRRYHQYLDRLEGARIAWALERGSMPSIALVQPATYPFKTAGPRRMLWPTLGFFLGISGGIALAFLAQHLDHSFQTPEDVEKYLGLPTLAAIPYVPVKRRLPKRKTKGLNA